MSSDFIITPSKLRNLWNLSFNPKLKGLISASENFYSQEASIIRSMLRLFYDTGNKVADWSTDGKYYTGPSEAIPNLHLS